MQQALPKARGRRKRALFDRSPQRDIRAGLHDRLVTFHLVACSAYPERPTISLALDSNTERSGLFPLPFLPEDKSNSNPAYPWSRDKRPSLLQEPVAGFS